MVVGMAFDTEVTAATMLDEAAAEEDAAISPTDLVPADLDSPDVAAENPEGDPNCGDGEEYAGGSSSVVSCAATPLTADFEPSAGRKFTLIFRS